MIVDEMMLEQEEGRASSRLILGSESLAPVGEFKAQTRGKSYQEENSPREEK